LLSDKTIESAKVFRNCDIGFVCEGRCAVGTITSENMVDAGATPRDVLGIPDQLLGIRGVDIAVAFIEEINGWRVSLRAAHDKSIKDMALKFGGGYSSSHIGAFNTMEDPLTVMVNLMPYIYEQCKGNVMKPKENPFVEFEKDRPRWGVKSKIKLPFFKVKANADISENHQWMVASGI